MVFTEPCYVGYSDINKELGLSNTALLKYFENAASLHGSTVGNGLGSSPARVRRKPADHQPEYPAAPRLRNPVHHSSVSREMLSVP